MKILVLYYSKTGNTKKLAEVIAEGVNEAGAEAVLKSTEEAVPEDFAESAGMIAGSPVYFGTMAGPLKQTIDDFVVVRRQGKSEGKVGAAFATAAFDTGGRETTIMGILQAMLIYGMVVVGDPLSATGHYGVGSLGAPDDKVKVLAKKLAARVVEVAKKLQD